MTISFREQYAHIQDVEATKNALFEVDNALSSYSIGLNSTQNMLNEIERLKSHLADINARLEREKDTSILYYNRCKDIDASLNNLKRVEVNQSAPVPADCGSLTPPEFQRLRLGPDRWRLHECRLFLILLLDTSFITRHFTVPRRFAKICRNWRTRSCAGPQKLGYWLCSKSDA